MNDDFAMSDDDLPDPVFRRALENAPDHAAVPNFHLRKTIRDMAHGAAGPSDAEITESLDRSWWRQLLGLGAPRKSRAPWNAAFATVLVAVLVTLLWQRQPVPGPQLDSQAPATAPAAPAASNEASAPRAAESSGKSAGTGEARIALPPTVPVAPELPPAPPDEPKPLPTPSARDIEIQAALRKAEQAEREAQDLARQAVPIPGTGVARPPAAPAMAPSVEQAKAPDRRSARARDDLAAAAPQAGAAAPAFEAPAVNKARSAEAGPAASSARTDTSGPPTFTALGQWTRMTVVGPNGESRSYSRAEARELGGLVGSAALAALGPQPLHNKVEWRVTLERNGKPLAQFELARSEVRWREGAGQPATGQPPEGALDGLREALREAMAPPVGAPQPAPAVPLQAEPPPAPRPKPPAADTQ